MIAGNAKTPSRLRISPRDLRQDFFDRYDSMNCEGNEGAAAADQIPDVASASIAHLFTHCACLKYMMIDIYYS
jgi:hypothetical protein